MSAPAYLPALLDLVELVRRGELVEVVVHHDDGCAHWRGRPCDCHPEVEVVEPEAVDA